MFQLPRDCRVFVALKPAAQWGFNEIFQNKMVYLLDTLVWQNTKDAQKKMPKAKPQPFVPEFMQAEQDDINDGMEKHTTEDIQNILSMPRNHSPAVENT